MKESFYKKYFELEKENWWFRVRRNIIFWLFKKYKLDFNKKIFDYGCGSGFLIGQMQNIGIDASGGDVSGEAIRMGQSRGVKNLFLINGVNSGFPDNSFDVVLALDVVEHIEDDGSVAEEFKRLLKPDGYLIITVPAYQWMWGVQDEAAHHYRRYSMAAILRLLSKFPQFRILKKTYFNTFLFLPIAIVRLLSKWFNIKSRESDFDINNNPLNKVLYFIFNLEIYFLKFLNFPFGVSILMVVKKNGQILKN